MKSQLAMMCAVLLAAGVLECAKKETPATPLQPTKGVAKSKPAQTKSTETTSESASGRTDVGDTMPVYTAKLLDGKPFDLASEKGKVVFLNVWATWCGPCRFEVPELQNLHKQYADKGLDVIGISVDEGGIDDVKNFVNEQKITYPIAVDPDGHIANLLQTTVLPTSLLIGRNGKIVWRQIGAIMPNDAKLKEALEKAVAEKG